MKEIDGGEIVNQVCDTPFRKFTRDLILFLKAVGRGLRIKSKSETTLLLLHLSVRGFRHAGSPGSCCSRWRSSPAAWRPTARCWSPLQQCRPRWDPQWPVASAGYPRSEPGGRRLRKEDTQSALKEMFQTEEAAKDKALTSHYAVYFWDVYEKSKLLWEKPWNFVTQKQRQYCDHR